MKSLFAIPRLSFPETFTILITLVVCLAGFTEAEVKEYVNNERRNMSSNGGYITLQHLSPLMFSQNLNLSFQKLHSIKSTRQIYSDYRKEDSNYQEEKNFLPKESSFKENDRPTLETSNARNGELNQNYYAYLKRLPGSPLDKLNERYSVYFGEPDEFDSEKENDGYNYDEDEYYHFNYKRNDQNNNKIENNKLEKEKLDEPERKEILDPNYYTKNLKGTKDKDQEIKTIEMLNYKEFHPNLGADSSQNTLQNQKQFSKDSGHKKIFSSEPLDTLNVIDLKDNSAIDETLKDRKEESNSILASVPSDSKIIEVKKAVKTTDEKDSVELKDRKSSEDSVKKDKEVPLKDGKEAVSAKNLKDSSKTSDEKEKGVKLSESVKLEENVEKVSGDNKERDTAKITKEDKDISRFSNKITSDAINPKEITQINNRVNFVSNRYKESLDNIKIPESQINEKNSEDVSENEKNVGLNNFPQSFNEEEYNQITDKNDNYRLLNEHSDLAKVFQNQEKSSPYFTVPLNYGFQQDKSNELYKKRESWKSPNNMRLKLPPQQPLMPEPTLQPPQQSQLDLSYDFQQKQNNFQNIENSLPTNELENTDYYKNYMKSLRKYKSQNENSKNINPESPPLGYNIVRKLAFRDKGETKKKKRSKPKKRRLLLSEKMSQEKEQINLSKLRNNNYDIQDTLLSQSEKSMVPADDSQLLPVEAEKEDTKLLEHKKHEEQVENNRLRRKSPLKLEYEIKVINQSPHDSKSAQVSRFSSSRLKKDIKTKPAMGDKYLKKYPYSHVNRDDLTGLNEITESKNEKKFKRKAPVQKRYDQKSVRTRAAPSGYYGNRVKFGQKSFTRNNEKTNSDDNIPMDVNRMSSSYFTPGSPSNFDKNYQSGWESKQQSLNSDDGAYLREDNSLFLIKKGERTAKAFEENSNKPSLSLEELDAEQLAKILSKANDYVVLKKTDNKFRKISDYEPSSFSPSDFDSFSLYNNKPTFAEQLPQYNFKNNDRPISLDSKNLRTRSSNPRKDDNKYMATFHSSTSKSNLKKTLDKFKDLADFFKDNEQESTDNQYSVQEAKEGREIVFSEDKLPDPIVINSDGSEKIEGLNQKPQNSIYSISTNFKNIDMPDKKNESPNNSDEAETLFTAGIKSDATDTSWNPALKTLFPEAKSINSMSKNGNEIIVLDFNRNQLKTHQGFHAQQKMPKTQSFGTYNTNTPAPSTNPLNFLGDRRVQLIFEGNPLSWKARDKNKIENLKSQMSGEQNKNYALTSTGEKQSAVSTPLEYVELPSLLKNLIKKNVITFNTKTVRKKSKEETENYEQFLKDLDNLSEIDKSSFTKDYYSDPREAKNVIKTDLPSNSFSELSGYSDMNIKQLGNILQNMLPKDCPTYTERDSKSDRETSKYSNQYQNLNNAYEDTVKYGVDFVLEHPSQWFPNEEKKEDKMENVPKEDKDEMSSILQNQEMSKIKDKNYAQLRNQIEKASDKVQRLRRGEMEKRNLEKTVDHAMILKGNEASDMKLQEQNMKMSPDLTILNSNYLIADEEKNEKDSKFQTLKEDDESKRNSEEEESLDSDYDSHLSELFENLSKNPKNPSESTWNRQKRFSGRDLEDKVSKTEVQNTILKNLPEDNYQSVYSPGIKRRLLSIKNEAENADADEKMLDKNTAKETQENCVRNAANKCVGPTILELFGNEGNEEEKIRGRRSLTSPFHTNFKREIDLDESMPNDFQNFLVTSLGGVGNQKREVVKKDDALWGGKESSQHNYNQIVENSSDGKDANGDSALEKREVSSGENRKVQGYSKSDYYSSRSDSDSNFVEIMNSINRAEKKIRSDSKSKIRSKSSEFADEKLPTQIRIQITNGSSKEKKSSKPIMDESETPSTEVENLPKEKEFFDKNKINPLLSNNQAPKVHQSKFSYGEFKEDESKDLSDKQKSYHSYQRRKRKKKKFVPENSVKPEKDFVAFDQNAMESLLRKYESDQNLMSDQITQKIPVSHPLPQVETVYNPTQGTNKAQLETTRLDKMNSITNKNVESSKNSLQSNDVSTYDEGIFRSYLKLDKVKSNKEGLKEFEEVDWKPYTKKLGYEQQPGKDNQFGIMYPSPEIHSGTPPIFSTNLDPSSLNIYTPNLNTYGQRSYQPPYSRFFNHVPSPNAISNQFMYDVLKLKEELKSKNSMNRDHGNNKPFPTPYYFSDGGYKQEETDKVQNSVNPYLNTRDRSWNYFDHNFNKKPYAQKYRIKDYYPLVIQNTNQVEQRPKNPYFGAKKFLKSFSFDKLLNFDNQSPVIENYRDVDYLDNIDDDYLDEYPNKDSQLEEPLAKDVLKKSYLNKPQETPSYYHVYGLKSSDVDDGLNEDDDELEEDYEENADEEDLDDYSFLMNSNLDDPRLTKHFHGTENFQSYEAQPDILPEFGYYNPEVRENDIDLTKFISSFDDKLDLGIMDTDFRKNSNPMSRSTVLLQKANENSKVFDNNVMKNMNKFRNNIAWNHMNELQIDKTLNDWHSLIKNDLDMERLRQEKLKRSQEYPQVGSRLFYAAKTEINNDGDLTPAIKIHKIKDGRSRKRSHHQTPLTDSFHVEFVGLGNDFDSGLEKNEKHIGENLMISEKTQKDEDEGIKENLEGDGDAVALDNYLENVIGKYIMRKTIKSSTDSDKASTKNKKKRELDNSIKRKIKKRSIQNQQFNGKETKILKKRLSSGHLTENNFRKYHKKNFSRKRNIKDLNFNPYEATALTREGQNIRTKSTNSENEKQKKRSALDIFKKITNKDRDNKKVENSDGRTAGFEPLLSLTDKKYDNPVKNSPLVQDKKSSSESLQTPETKGNVPELKAHYPNEGQHLRAQLNEKKGEKSKETLKEYPTSLAQGPWKVDLNDKYESKAVERLDKEHRKSLKNEKIIEPKLSKGGDENLKAFLVISKNARRFKRKLDNSFPVSELFIRQTSNSCRPMSVEGGDISKKLVRKRSLAGMKSSKEDAVKASEGQFLKKQGSSRALLGTESLFEGDSKPQASNELQRNVEKNGSFVNVNEQCKNSRFLSRERLTKSVFSPMSDANIIRNSRHINEETSEYLGQQIVDAILFHVNANPKFRQLIAPGLTMRTTAFKEDNEYNKKRALHKVEFSEQLQAFFKKFMFDLEKLTEKHMKKRMCYEIDKQSKHFLQSLLMAPTESVKEEEKIDEIREKMSPSNKLRLEVKSDQNLGSLPFMAATFDGPEKVNLNLMNERLLKPKQHVFEDLPVKNDFLLKLINNYQNSLKVEKETLNKNYRPFQEVDQTSHPLIVPKNWPYLTLTSGSREKNNFQNDTSTTYNNQTDLGGTIKLKMIKSTKKSNDQCTAVLGTTSSGSEVVDKNETQSVLLKSSSDFPNTQLPDNIEPVSVYYFTEIENPNKYPEFQTTTPYNPFETVNSANITENTPNQETKHQEKPSEEYNITESQDRPLVFPTSQSFDLLSYQGSTIKRNVVGNSEFVAKDKIHESPIKKKTDNLHLYQPNDEPKILYKTSLGDAARFHLPLKYQNLDVAKTLRSVPKISEPKAILKANQLLQKSTGQFLEESRNPRSLITSHNEYSIEKAFLTGNNWSPKAKYFYSRPIFSSKVDKKFYIPKVRPFENATQHKWPTIAGQTRPLEYFLRKGSPPTDQKINKNSHGKSFQNENSFLRRYFRKKRKRRVPHFLIHHPKEGQKN